MVVKLHTIFGQAFTKNRKPLKNIQKNVQITSRENSLFINII